MIPLEDMMSPRGVHAVDWCITENCWRAYFYARPGNAIYLNIDGATPREAVEKAYALILANRLTE